MKTIGFATIGQTPRSDLVPYLVERLPAPARILEAGVLDGLSTDEIAALDLGDEGLHMVTLLADGTSARLAFTAALPRMQGIVDDLVDAGADLIVILCGADWSQVTAPVPVVNPGRFFPATVGALAGRNRLGVIRPSAGQVAHTVREYRDGLGLDAVVTSAFPYDDARLEAAEAAARELAEQDAELIWMTCVGMDEDMREAVRRVHDRPIILARSLLARAIGELVA